MASSNSTGSWEEQFMAGVPSRLAGPLTVCMSSFALMTLVWMALAKRPSTSRLNSEAKQKNTGIKTIKAELATRIISWVHAFVIAQAGVRMLYAYVMEVPGPDGVVLEKGVPGMDWSSPFIEFYVAGSTAYFAGDVIVCLVQLEDYGLPFLFHACCGLGGMGWVLLSGQAHVYAILAFLFELSTPFVNNIFLLKTYAPNWPLLSTLNGVCLLVVFLGVRLVFGLPASFAMWSDLRANYQAGKLSDAAFGCWTVLIAGLNFLNLTWGYKLVMGFLNIVCGGKKKQSNKKKKK